MVIFIFLPILIALIALSGWIFDLEFLQTINFHWPGIKINSIIAIIFSGISLLLLSAQRKKNLAFFLAAIVFLIGILSLSEYLFHWNAHIDELFFSDKKTPAAIHPGRMARITAYIFIILGISLLACSFKKRWSQWLTEFSAILLLIISFGGLISNLYNAGQLFKIAKLESFSFPTIFSIMLLSLGILFSKPDTGFLSSFLRRTTAARTGIKGIFIVIIFLIVIGWLCIKGEEAGLFNTELGLVIMVTTFSVIIVFVVWSGIHSLNLAEERLSASEKNLRYVLSSSTDIFYVIDRNYHITLINETAKETLTKHWGKPVSSGVDVLKLIPDGRVELIKNSYDRVFNGEKVEYEFYYSSGDISEWFLINYMPVRDDAGNIIGCYVVTKNITDRKTKEDLIKESEAKFKAFYENSMDGILLVTPYGDVLAANPSACLMFGMTEKEICKIGREGLVDSTDSRISTYIKERQRIGKAKGELRFLRKDGSKFHAEITSSFFIDVHGNKMTSVIIRDITERKKVEEALQKSESRLNEAQHIAHIGSWELDIVNNTLLWSDEVYKIFEIEPGKFGASYEAFLDTIHPEDREIVNKTYADSVKNRTSFSLEHRLLFPDGRIKFVHEQCETFYNKEGKPFRSLGTVQDFTERRKIQEEIFKSNERFELIAATTHDAIWEWNLETGELWANATHQGLYGLTKADPVPSNEMWIQRIHPDDRDLIVNGLEKKLNSEENVWQSEYRFQSPSGDYINIYDRTYIVRNADGKVIRTMGSMMDITERKKAEEQYKTILNTTIDGFYLVDLEGNILDTNDSYCKMIGYSRDELLKMSIKNIDVVDTEEVIKNRIQHIMNTGSVFFETRHKHKDGRIIDIEASCNFLKDEKKTLFVFMRDITERKKAEEALVESENLLRTIVEAEPECVKLLSINNEIENMNPAGLGMIEADRLEQVKGKSVLGIINQPYRKRFEKLTQDVFQGKSGALEFEITGLKGTRCWLETHAVPLKDSEGKIISLLAVTKDITNRKKAEKELEKSYKSARQLTAHLQDVREKERTHIAREIHDELGQQLTVLKLDASWLYNQLQATAEDSVKQKLKNLIELLDNNVKTVRRISSDLRPTLLDDMGLIAAMEWQLKEFEKRDSVKTYFTIPEKALSIPDNFKTGLFRIFQESLTNVARHADAKNIEVSLQQNNGKLILKIKDDGKGFDKIKVTGKKTLGLMGMKERSIMMGGHYKISSKPGKGTLVTVSIPYKN